MDSTKTALALVILAVLSITLASGANLNEASQESVVTADTPVHKTEFEHLVDALTGYRVSGVTSHACAQIGGMYIMYNCIIITADSDMKTVRLGGKKMDD